MSSTPHSRDSPSFFREELKRALNEQMFGIAAYTLGPFSAFQASARVSLLERVEIDIALSIRGYQVVNIAHPTCASSASHASFISAHLSAEPVFEAIESMLQELSPLYSSRRAEALYSRLTN